MELAITPSNDGGYTIVYKDISERPKPTPVLKTYNALSEKLYDKNITDTEIRKLNADGAKLNYQKPGNNGPVIFNFACDSTPQGVKNMQTMIELGAAIHNIEDEEHTPLTIALEGGGYAGKRGDGLSGIIQLLIPYENPIVTVYTKTEDRDGEPFTWTHYSQEKSIREFLISNSICDQNIATIKMLLDLKLMTANRALKTFAFYKDPNQKVLDLLLAYGATNAAFPRFNHLKFSSTQYIDFLKQMCGSKEAFNRESLAKILVIQKDVDAIKKDIDAIVSSLQDNDPTISPF
jgi:hypothetical protein